jgi:hypothetical protein
LPVKTGLIRAALLIIPEGRKEWSNFMKLSRRAWILVVFFQAAPLYQTPEVRFRTRKDNARALYAEASQLPAIMESRPLPDLIAYAKRLLKQPGAQEPHTHLRILTVEGMLDLEYDAAQAKTTWAEVETEANRLGEHRLVARASSEQGILAFLLGDVAEASQRVRKAYLMAKVLRDRPAEVR